jgi:photosystem II stability/assembly factor-like uncharacterized protein
MSIRGGRRLARLVVQVCAFLGLADASPAASQAAPVADRISSLEQVVGKLEWRSIGPAIMGGRFVDITADPSDPYTIYAAHSTGGVFRTSDNGVSWEPLFQHEGTTNVGAVAVARADPQIVWIGTGEGNNRNSTGWGKGVYKSTDRGKTWRNMGLRDSHHIPAGCIIVHPRLPNTVYVCAAGRLWGVGGERGVYKTTDGGESWRRILHVNESTGFTHMVMDPRDPDVLYAAAYERVRGPFHFAGTGPGSGIYKTTDGGASWTELTDATKSNGLPTEDLGRIGLAIYEVDPRIVMAIIEARGDSTSQGRAGAAGATSSNVYRSEDRGLTWRRVSEAPIDGSGSYYSKIRINPRDDQDVWVLAVYLNRSRDGGRTYDLDTTERGARWVHGDHHAMWINPDDPRHVVMGSDGGVYLSFDGGTRWDYINTLPVAQFYEVGYDYRVPYTVCGGTQDNGSWCGPSDAWEYWGITNRNWYWVHGADGFEVQIDPASPWRLYVGSQNGNYHRLDMRDWRKESIRPSPTAPDGQELCWDWNTPLTLSRHDPSILYTGAQYLFRLTAHGDRGDAISPDLTRGAQGGDCRALRTIAESFHDPAVLWTGSNDGYVHVTRDGGRTWANVTRNIAGGPDRWNAYHVAGLAASRHAPGTAYVALDGHRSDDYAPHVFVTTDFGATWRDITGNLPANGSVYVVREDHRNPNLLFVGTEFGVFTSLDRGSNWIRLNNNLPDVPIYDLEIHDRDNDLIAGTHGRSIWIADISLLQELTSGLLDRAAHLFDVKAAYIHDVPRMIDIVGHKFFHAPRKPYGTTISYFLRDDQDGDVELVIRDADGNVVRRLSGPGYAGLQRVTWNLRRDEPRMRGLGDPPTDLGGGDSPGARGIGRVPRSGSLLEVLPGTYTVSLRIADTELTKPVVVRRLTPAQRGDPWYVELPEGGRR